jgi:hypothetical protein
VTEGAQEMNASVARKIFLWQMIFFGVLLILSALGNGYTVLADHARGGDPLPTWKPMVWEFSSHLMTWLLVPPVSWWLGKFPLTRTDWWRSLPAHRQYHLTQLRHQCTAARPPPAPLITFPLAPPRHGR